MQQLDESTGRSARPVVAGMMALAGALLLFALLFTDFSDLAASDPAQLPWGLMLRYMVAMAIGGALAGSLLAGLFGRSGLSGWLLALIGGLIASIVAGVVGSFIGQLPDLISGGWQTGMSVAIASGALVLPLALFGWPHLVVVWAAIVAGTHLWVRRRRAG